MPYVGPTFDHLGPPTPLGTPMQRYLRRAAVWSGYLISFAVLLGASPVLYPLFAIVDLFSRTRWTLIRTLSFFLIYLAFELYAVVHIFVVYLCFGPWIRKNYERFYQENLRIQQMWVNTITRLCLRLFRMKISVEGEECLAKGPYLLFVRHSSMFDTVLAPFHIFPKGIGLRVVVKREMLYDAAVEFSLNTMPNYFVDRNSNNSEKEIEAVGNLTENLSDDEAIFIYPEGTRRTPEKHARILEKLKAAGDEAAYATAASYKHVLPPRPGGSLELLRRNPGCDLVVCAHAGLDQTVSWSHIYHGGLVGTDIRLGFWRIPFSDIPTDPAEQRTWLFDQWKRVDDWVDERTPSGEDDTTARDTARA